MVRVRINVFVYIFPNHGRLQTTLFHWNINYMKDALYARNGLDAWGRGPSHAKYRYKRTLFYRWNCKLSTDKIMQKAIMRQAALLELQELLKESLFFAKAQVLGVSSSQNQITRIFWPQGNKVFSTR